MSDLKNPTEYMQETWKEYDYPSVPKLIEKDKTYRVPEKGGGTCLYKVVEVKDSYLILLDIKADKKKKVNRQQFQNRLESGEIYVSANTLTTLIAALKTIASDQLKVKKSENELEVMIDNVGEASGEFSFLEDEEEMMEMPPLGLMSYGEDVAKEIIDKIEDVSHIFYLHSIKIDPSVRKKGYGEILLNKIEEEAKKEKVDAIMANASPFGYGADRVPFSVIKKFYKKRGYEFLYDYQGQNALIIKRL